MPRGVALHDLVDDERGEGPGAEHGQQLERNDRGVCCAPARVGGGIFAPCAEPTNQHAPCGSSAKAAEMEPKEEESKPVLGGDWRMQKKRDQQRCFNKWKLTHLRKDARGRIYGSPEGRQGQEGALEDRVDKHVKRLSFMCPFLIFRIR